MDYGQEREHFINEVLAYGRNMKTIGFAQAMESVNGIEKAETSTFSSAQAYLASRKVQEEQERARVIYAINKLIDMGIEHGRSK